MITIKTKTIKSNKNNNENNNKNNNDNSNNKENNKGRLVYSRCASFDLTKAWRTNRRTDRWTDLIGMCGRIQNSKSNKNNNNNNKKWDNVVTDNNASTTFANAMT